MSLTAGALQGKASLPAHTKRALSRHPHHAPCRHPVWQACKRHGRLAAEAEAHAANLRARDALIRDTASRLAILLHAPPPLLPAAGAPLPALPPSAVEAFTAELSARASELARELSEAKAANRRQDESLTGEVDKANAALSRASEMRRMKQEQQQQLQRSADGVAAEVSAGGVLRFRIARADACKPGF